MKKKLVTLLVSILVLMLFVFMFEHASAASEDTWVSKASMAHARANLATAAVNGKIYAIGGDAGSETGCCMTGTSMTYNVVNYTEEYDPILNHWAEKASMPTPRAFFGTAVYQGKIYCIGGYNGATVKTGPQDYEWETQYYALSANEAYDPASNNWTTGSPMPTARNKAATNIVDGKIFVIGGIGMGNFETYNTTEVYDPETDSWTTKTPAPLPVASPASAVVDKKIYVLGQNPKGYSNIVEIYDPATDTWVVKDVATVSYAATAVATTGVNALKRIYFFDDKRTDIYDPATNTWSVGTPVPTTNLLLAKAAVLDDIIYLLGGRTGQLEHIVLMYPSNLTEQYFPMGYGIPDHSTPTPPPTPTPSPMPIASPTGNVTSPSEQVPPEQVSSVGDQASSQQINPLILISGTAVVLVGIVSMLSIIKKRR